MGDRVLDAPAFGYGPLEFDDRAAFVGAGETVVPDEFAHGFDLFLAVDGPLGKRRLFDRNCRLTAENRQSVIHIVESFVWAAERRRPLCDHPSGSTIRFNRFCSTSESFSYN